MKSYNHLYEIYIADDNYYSAVIGATRNKGGSNRKRREARYYRDHIDELKPEILEYAANFYNDEHHPVEINDGIRRKKREIIVPSMREQVVHHMVVNTLAPIMLSSMYYHSYGSIPGRGAMSGNNAKNTKSGKDAVEKFIRTHPDDCKYCLQLDIHKFYDSVPHDILKDKLHKIIHDEKFLKVIDTIIEVNGKDVGIPIGFYTSQWFANYYLTCLDHYIKEQLGAKGYFRYMDDMVIFGSNKRKLHKMKESIEEYLNTNLGLELNPAWQVFKFHYIKKDGKEIGRFLDFMGFRFYRNRTTLRRGIMLKASRKARRIAKKHPRTAYDFKQMLSYKGWISNADVYGMYKKWIKPYVSFRLMRKYVGHVQRKENEERKKKDVAQK